MRNYYYFLFLIIILGLTACSRTWTSQSFSYPPDSKPHEENWSHRGQITVLHLFGEPAKTHGNKTMRIVINDKEGNSLLNDELNITGGLFRHKIDWFEFGTLKIQTYEEGENKENLVLELLYKFNGSKFVPNS